jgi:hypothetical protein
MASSEPKIRAAKIQGTFIFSNSWPKSKVNRKTALIKRNMFAIKVEEARFFISNEKCYISLD